MKVSTIAVATTALVFWLYSPPAHAQTNGMERAKAVKERVAPRLSKELTALGLHFGDPVFLRILKEERELELWMQEPDKKSFKLFRTYRIAAMSGKLGPKLKEGDRQAPEGFYFVNRGRLKPDSVFHLAMNIGYPNIYDRAHGRGGSFLMIHGNRVSIGCFAMTDAKIEEIYTLCDAALQKGQPLFRVHCFPFHMTKERMVKASGDRWEPFWKNLKEGYDAFENGKIPPNVEVEKKRYLFTR
jgi:murein L,D-transpeptidase YafK